jgi:hypothetical protein
VSTDRDVTSIVRSWLDEGVTELPDRVLDAVLDQLPATPQRRAWWPARRFPDMNMTAKYGIAAAAIVVAAAIGVMLIEPNVGGPQRPAATGTPPSTAKTLPTSGTLSPGTYTIADPFPLRVLITTEGDWNVWSAITAQGAAIYQESPDPPNGRGVIVVLVDNVYANPCAPGEGLLDPPLGPSVDDLAQALASQPRTDASPITDVSVGGYSGKYLEYTMTGPEAGCEVSALTRFPTVAGPRQAVQHEHDQVWILDVDGVRLMIDAFSFQRGTKAEIAELERIVESIQIEP